MFTVFLIMILHKPTRRRTDMKYQKPKYETVELLEEDIMTASGAPSEEEKTPVLEKISETSASVVANILDILGQ